MLNTAIFSRVRKAAGRFARADQGNIAVLFAIAAVPIISFVGAAIDYTRANSARSSMQAALEFHRPDGGERPSDGTIRPRNQHQGAGLFQGALHQHRSQGGDGQCELYRQHRQGLDHRGQRLRQRADRVHEGRRLPEIGFDTSSTSAWGNVRMRVALALDVTGSMNDDGKMTAMKPAAKSPDRPDQRPREESRRRLHFGHSLRQGRQRRRQQLQQTWIEWSEWEDENGKCSGKNSGNYPTKSSVNGRQDLEQEPR